MTIDEAKRLKITSFLYHIGHKPVSENTRNAYYLSPLRSEKHPSFVVDVLNNWWFDNGTGQNGDIINLVSLKYNLSTSEALKAIAELNIIEHQDLEQRTYVREYSTKKNFQISALKHPVLISYLQSRRINVEYASQYVLQANYEHNEKPYYTLAFQNDKKGHTLRNLYFKGVHGPNTITTIKFNDSNIFLLFEGFTDFLSALTINNTIQFKYNVIVFNSWLCVHHINNLIYKNSKFHYFGQNDNKGNECFEILKSFGFSVADHRFLYYNHKDFKRIFNEISSTK